MTEWSDLLKNYSRRPVNGLNVGTILETIPKSVEKIRRKSKVRLGEAVKNILEVKCGGVHLGEYSERVILSLDTVKIDSKDENTLEAIKSFQKEHSNFLGYKSVQMTTFENPENFYQLFLHMDLTKNHWKRSEIDNMSGLVERLIQFSIAQPNLFESVNMGVYTKNQNHEIYSRKWCPGKSEEFVEEGDKESLNYMTQSPSLWVHIPLAKIGVRAAFLQENIDGEFGSQFQKKYRGVIVPK